MQGKKPAAGLATSLPLPSLADWFSFGHAYVGISATKL